MDHKPLAIVGSNAKTRGDAPLDNPEIEIWVFNEAPQAEWCTRWDVSFQLHIPEVYSSPNNFVRKDHWTWLQQKRGKPIYMIDVDARVPDSVRYPLEDVLSLIPYRYLRSSPAEALGLAISQGYTDISLYGCELISNTEYQYQAVNMAFWIGFAHGLGIDLKLRSWQDEFNQPIYGFEGQVTLKSDYFSVRLCELEPVWKNNEQELNRIKDRLKAAMLEHQYAKVANLAVEFERLAIITGEVAGQMGEAEKYAAKNGDFIPRQEFEHASALAQREGEELRALMYASTGKAEYVWNIWKQTGRFEALSQLRGFMDQKGQQAYDMGARLGIHRENYKYMLDLDACITAAGGERAVSQVVQNA